MPKIALVDDDKNIITSLSIALRHAGFDVDCYEEGRSALDVLSKHPTDIGVFDVKMPRMDGLTLLQNLRKTSDMPVIFLTSKDSEIDELCGLKIGADDYITKPFSQKLLIERIRVILRRRQLSSPLRRDKTSKNTSDVKICGQLQLYLERHECFWKNKKVNLTVTEFILIHCLVDRAGIVKSRDALMDVAYDDQTYVDYRTIDSHIKRLRQKFKKVDDSFNAIETLYGVGYKYNQE